MAEFLSCPGLLASRNETPMAVKTRTFHCFDYPRALKSGRDERGKGPRILEETDDVFFQTYD